MLDVVVSLFVVALDIGYDLRYIQDLVYTWRSPVTVPTPAGNLTLPTWLVRSLVLLAVGGAAGGGFFVGTGGDEGGDIWHAHEQTIETVASLQATVSRLSAQVESQQKALDRNTAAMDRLNSRIDQILRRP